MNTSIAPCGKEYQLLARNFGLTLPPNIGVEADAGELFPKRDGGLKAFFSPAETGVLSLVVQQRDPDAEGVSGMSGTKAREAAISGDIGKFRAATGWDGEIASLLMKAVRDGLGVE